jgi:hypothetical protein
MERRGFMVLHRHALPPGHSQGNSAIKVMPGRLKPSAPPRLAGEIKQKHLKSNPRAAIAYPATRSLPAETNNGRGRPSRLHRLNEPALTLENRFNRRQ